MAAAPVLAALPAAVMPDLTHLSPADFEAVYEPQEDTWLLCDALLAEAPALVARAPALAVEIGPGSGAVSCYVVQLLAARARFRPAVLACDINLHACAATAATAAANGVARRVDVVACDLVSSTGGRLHGAVDLLLFNPPYVPTPDDDVWRGGGGSGDLSAAWAGGADGRVVIDRVLPLLPLLLSRPRGVAYMVVVEENR